MLTTLHCPASVLALSFLLGKGVSMVMQERFTYLADWEDFSENSAARFYLQCC
jgi:hypothetical protein